MASEEEERLAKMQQDKIDKEKFETELAEAGITVPSEDALVTMKAMIELLGFMKTKMVEDVFTKVVSQTAASSSNDSAAESLADKLKAKSAENPHLTLLHHLHILLKLHLYSLMLTTKVDLLLSLIVLVIFPEKNLWSLIFAVAQCIFGGWSYKATTLLIQTI